MLRRLLAGALAVSAMSPALSGQADPRAAFTDALARFSLALDGAYGDEGALAAASLDAMDRARRQWDTQIRGYESAMAAEIGTAAPDLATRMHLALGGVYLERGRVQDAVRELGEAARIAPGRSDVHALLGLIHGQLAANPALAASEWRKAAALSPTDAPTAYQLARQLEAVEGSPEAAGTALEGFLASAKEVAPEAAGAAPFLQLGLVREVPGIEPFFPPAAYAAGFALLREGRYEEAISRFRTVTVLDPLFTPPAADRDVLARSAAALRDGDARAAVTALLAAVARGPTSGELHRLLGLAHLAAEEDDEGLTQLQAAIELNPMDERARLDLAGALLERGAFADAGKVLTDTLAVMPNSGRAHYRLGRVYERQGNYTDAVRALDEAAALTPLLGLNSVYQTLGAFHRSQQNYDGAIEAFSRRIALVPNDAPAHHDLGEMYVRKGRLTEALAEFTVALMLEPDRVATHVAIGQVHLREGRFDEAARAARQAVALDGQNKEGRYVLATALMRQGRTAEGAAELQAYQRLQAEATALQSKRLELAGLRRDATVSTTNGEFEKAVGFLRRVLAADRDDLSARVDLGLALLKAGQAAEAIDHLKAGLAPDAPPDVHRYLSDAYAATGQAEESQRERALYARARQDALRRAGAAR